MKTIRIPKELLWDYYKEPPDDLLWRLQRIGDFFPAYGTERKTIKLLLKYRHKLKLEEGADKLIVLYHEVWKKKPVRGVKDNRVLTPSQIQPIGRLAQIGRKRSIPSHRDLREAMRPMRRRSEEIIRRDRDAR